MTFEIKYFDLRSEHITLYAAGEIGLYQYGKEGEIKLSRNQSKMLKKMIIAESLLEKKE